MKYLTRAATAIASPFYALISRPQKRGRGMLRCSQLLLPGSAAQGGAAAWRKADAERYRTASAQEVFHVARSIPISDRH
jgi:hypothetical protein